MNILHIAGGLPTAERPSLQPFIQEQINSIKREGVNVETLDLRGYESLLNYITYSKRIKQIVKEKNINVIHAHYGYCGITALLSKTKLPIVLSLMGSDLLGSPDEQGNITLRGRFDRFITTYAAKKVDKIIVKSPEMEDKIKLKEPASVIPNGVNFSLFKPGDKKQSRQALGLDGDKFLVLFLGDPRLNRKNYKLAKEGFEKFILENKISNTQLIAPFGISQVDVIKYMNSADVLLLTSYWEGSPNVIKESMACNLPIISVDVGDVKEVIKETFNCFLVDYSEGQIAEKLKIIYDNRLPSNGREKIEYLNDSVIAQKIIDIYKELISKNIQVHN